MKLSVLIVNWNTGDLLIKCVNSILKNQPNFDYEVIVVDNDSQDGSQEKLADFFAGQQMIKLIRAKENLGFARGNNLAYRHSSGEYILLLNPDTEIKHGALQRMVDYMEKNSPFAPSFQKRGEGELEIGILGPKLINPDGTLQPSVRRFPDVWSSLLIFSYLHHLIRPRKYLMDLFDYNKISEVDQVMGAALLTRSNIVEKLGFLDENFWLWYEEVDFCKRVKNAGYKIVFFPEAIIMHRGGVSFSQFDALKRKKTLAKSLVYYFQKNGRWWDVWMLKLLMPIVLFSAGILHFLSRDHSRPDSASRPPDRRCGQA